MNTFLTVNEAAKLTGKSASSIRRLIYPILKSDEHADRLHIEPDVGTAKALRMKGENFAWRVSEEFLRREVPMGEAGNKAGSSSHGATVSAGSEALIEMLRKELDIKNGQITQQSEMLSKQIELISGLSERLREGNILIGSLQQQLALPDGTSRRSSDVVDATSANAHPSEAVSGTKTKKEKGTDAAKAATPTDKKSLPKRGLLSRLFR